MLILVIRQVDVATSFLAGRERDIEKQRETASHRNPIILTSNSRSLARVQAAVRTVEKRTQAQGPCRGLIAFNNLSSRVYNILDKIQ